jgi:hypothetical protein
MAISAMPALNAFLRQSMRTPVNLEQSLRELEALFPEPPVAESEMDLPAPQQVSRVTQN